MKEYSYKVVGVTFDARDGSSRQETLKELFNEEVETESFLRGHNVKFEGYDFNGEDALAVFVDDKEIGNISANKVQEVAEIAQKASKCDVTFSVNGHDVDDYNYIVDRHVNKKEWAKDDPFFDSEEADEEYKKLNDGINENAIYSAVLHFYVPEETDGKTEKEEVVEEVKENNKKTPSKGMQYLLIGVSIVLVLMSLLLLLAQPIFGVIGIVIGIACFISARKNLKKIKETEENIKE